MPAPPDLITWEEFKEFYTGATQARVEPIIKAVSDEVRRFCKVNDFYIAEYTEIFSGRGQSYIQLGNVPVVADSVELYSDLGRVFPSYTKLESTAYFVDLKLGQIYPDSLYPFRRGNGNIQVTYEAGYAEEVEDLPPALKHACALWVAHTLKLWNNPDKIGQTGIRQGEITMTFDMGDPPMQVRKKLRRFMDSPI